MDNPERITYFAATDSRGKRIPFGIKAKDRGRHMYVIGKTGMGKSTLLENMAIQDIRNGEGLAFIDPHGSAVDKLLDYVPEERVKDVVYFAPFDLERPIAFNVMEDVGYDKRHLVTSGLMATFKKIWEDAWSARMEYILTNTLLALLEYPGATLLGVNRMYIDKEYRRKVVDNIKDPLVASFWKDEFANYGDRYTQEATPAIQNKIGQFTSNPVIRNIVGQEKSSFDIRQMMDERKILLINLSKGRIGDTNMRLLGSMITTRIFLAAMSRADLPEGQLARTAKCYFYVDEFQNFANETFAEILSEARKYNLNLIIAHQYIEQMEEEVRAAVFGNVGTTVTFRVGPFDAEVLETVFFPTFTKEDLVNLGARQVYLTLMIDGLGSQPFSAITIPPIEPPPISLRREVIENSRMTYGNERGPIETAIYDELASARDAMVEAHAEASSRPPRRGPARPPLERERTSAPRSYGPPERRAGTEPERPVPPSPARASLPETDTSASGRSQRSNRERRPPVGGPPAPGPNSAQGLAGRGKSAEDLRSILRSMTAKKEVETEKKVTEEKQSLKGALANVLTKEPPPREEGGGKPEPYEVPEDALKSVLRGDA
jgi:hypothetical protein